MLGMTQAKFQAGYLLESSVPLNVMQWKSILNDCLGKIITISSITEQRIKFNTPHCPRKTFPPFITIKSCGLGLHIKQAYQIVGQPVMFSILNQKRFMTVFMTYSDMELVRLDIDIEKPKNNIMKASEVSHHDAVQQIKAAIEIDFDDNFDFIMEGQIRRYKTNGAIYRHELASEALLNTNYLKFTDDMKETSFYDDYTALKRRMLNNAIINKFLDFEEEK